MTHEYSAFNKVKKFYRFIRIYGFNRTYVKFIARYRKYTFLLKIPLRFKRIKSKNVAIIGCGQFSFATIAYYLKATFGNVIYGVYDIDMCKATSFAKYYKCKIFNDSSELLKDKHIKYVYIASNHSSHSTYAIEALKNNKIVYVEKPISVSKTQFANLLEFVNHKKIYVGYNRPFAPAIKLIYSKLNIDLPRSPISINYTIIGHKIGTEHWYRNKEEGTRICGNLGHWLDLSIHLLSKIGLPETLDISIHTSSINEKDDNLIITLVSELGDIISIMFTAREEPFEGISENIVLQHRYLIAKIDDFRRITIWENEKIIRKKYFRKNVGHRKAIIQPFQRERERNFEEIKISTRLMLEIVENLKNNIDRFFFSIK